MGLKIHSMARLRTLRRYPALRTHAAKKYEAIRESLCECLLIIACQISASWQSYNGRAPFYRTKYAEIFFVFPGIAFSPASIVYAQESKCVLPANIERSISLDSGCNFSGGLTIKKSDVKLDCRGATIDARTVPVGIAVRGYAIRNVEIVNCRVFGARRTGIHIQAPLSDYDMNQLPMEERYEASARSISIINTTVMSSGVDGIYVGSYAMGTKIRGVSVEQSGSVGIYLEQSSVETSISGSQISRNGFGDPLGREKRRPFREGVAIDSSARNTIEGNRIDGNAAGGIFLYKNCWERSNNPRQVQRWQHSSYNEIRNNTFTDEPVGVWIASRQTMNMKNWECGDTPIAPGYYRDFADHNRVVANTFNSGRIGINIEDDYNHVLQNIFYEMTDSCVVVGSPLRDHLYGIGIRGTSLVGNSCNGIAGYTVQGLSKVDSCKGNKWNDIPYSCTLNK